MYTVDLKVAVLEQDQPAYMVHPGKHYHLFQAFLRRRVIAPDLPELTLQNGLDPARDRSLDTQIMRARALREWLALNSEQRGQTRYSVDLEDYDGHVKRRYHDNYVETVRLIFWELPKGAIIFVPSSDLAGQGFFCELESPQMERVSFVGPRKANRFSYLGRPVRNIKRVPMRLIPRGVLNTMTRQSIVTILDGELSERVFRLYYGSFSIAGGMTQVEMNIPTKVFRPADAAILSGLANLLEENLQRFEHGQINATQFTEALFMVFDETELQLHANLNSPGTVQVAGKSLSPILLSAFMILAAALSAQEIIDETTIRSQGNEIIERSIAITNTNCPEDDVYPRLIEERLFGILDMMGEDEIRLVCQRVEQFRQRTNASVNTVVE